MWLVHVLCALQPGVGGFQGLCLGIPVYTRRYAQTGRTQAKTHTFASNKYMLWGQWTNMLGHASLYQRCMNHSGIRWQPSPLLCEDKLLKASHAHMYGAQEAVGLWDRETSCLGAVWAAHG